MSAGTRPARIVRRWVRKDGTALLLLTNGSLMKRNAVRGLPRRVKARATLEEARAYAEAQGSYVEKIGGQWEDTTGLGCRRQRHFLGEPKLPATPKTDCSNAELTPEQQAEVDARVEGHRRRIAADLDRQRYAMKVCRLGFRRTLFGVDVEFWSEQGGWWWRVPHWVRKWSAVGVYRTWHEAVADCARQLHCQPELRGERR